MFSGNRSRASCICWGLFVACLLTALYPLMPAFGQTPPPVNLPGLTDALVHAPPATGPYGYNSFVPPLTQGTSYADPVFGTTVRRLTSDNTLNHSDIYARNMWWSADGKRYLHRVCCNGGDYWEVIEVATGQITHTNITGYGGLAANGGFDPVDPDALYYYNGSAIHKVTLNSNGTWTDSIYFTAPGGATIRDLGGTINWMDASGHYMVVRYGSEPSVHLYDRQTLAAGPYANPIVGTDYIDTNGYIGLTPDGQFLVGHNDTTIGVGMGAGVSWRIDHANRTVALLPNYFWDLCGDHGSFISASDGRNYMITNDCYTQAGLWRVDITNSIGVPGSFLSEALQQALPNNTLLLAYQTWNDFGHYSTVARGPLQDWAFLATEDGTDTFNSGTADANGNITPWHLYRQEIIAVNAITGEIRRLAHHRSRSENANYYYQNRVSASWGGEYVGWASNFNQSGVVDIYAIPFSVTSGTTDTTQPTVSIAAPANGATVAGSAVTVSASASDNVGVAGVQFKLDGANLGAEVTAAPYAVSWNTTTTGNGSHALTAVARDAAGNTATSVAVSVTVDNASPLISTVSASSISSSGVLITWATNEAGDSQVDYGLTTAYGTATPLNLTLATAHAVTLTGLLANTTYHYRVKSRDAAGNLAVSGDLTFTTLALSADTTPPGVPTNLSAGAVSFSQINLSWTASIDNVGVSGYQVYRGGSQIATTSLTSYADTGLSPATAYTYTVAAYDAAGNVSAQSAAASAVTLPPPSSGLVAAYGINEASGSVTADASSNSNTGTINGAAWTTSGKYGNALSFNGTSSYVEAADSDALTPGTGATFEAWVFLTSAPPELVSVFNKWSQTIDDEYLLGINPNQTLLFAWKTTGGGTWGTTSYNLTSGTGQIPLNAWTHIAVVRSGATLNFYINGNLDASISAMDTNAFRNGINTLRLGGQGRGGMNRFVNGRLDEMRIYNQALSQTEIQNDMNTAIGGTAPPDTATPGISMTAPAAGSTVSGTVTVSASATDNVGVVGVQFKLDGANLGAEATAAPYAVAWNSTLAGNGLHTLTAVARDAAGNSTTSAAVTVTVSNIILDTTPPVISAVASSSLTASGATITWTTNEASDSQVDYGLTTSYGGSTTLDATLVTTHSQALSGLAAGTLYHYRVKSRDASGNLAVSGDFTFTTTAGTPPGFVGYWKFDEGGGKTAMDSSGNGNTGTLVNGLKRTTGKFSRALSFDGVNDYVNISHKGIQNAYPLTVAAWIKTASTTGLKGIVNKYYPGSMNGYQVFMNEGNLCAWYFKDAADYVWDGSGCTLMTPGYNDNQWHQVVLVVDAGGGRLYVDGVLKASLGWTGTPGAATTTQNLRIGRYPGAASQYWPGIADDVRIYNYALSATEVAGLYSAATSGPQGVVWANPVNVTVTGNSLQKTSGCDGCGDAGAVSSQTIASGDGYVEFTIGETNSFWYGGLSHGNPGPSFDAINFAFRFNGGGQADVSENGVYKGGDTPYAVGDVFRVAVEGGQVKFRKNGTLIYMSAAAPTYPLLLDATLGTISGTVKNAMISP